MWVADEHGKLTFKLSILLLSFLFIASPVMALDVAKFEVDFFEKDSSAIVNHATVWISIRRVRIEQSLPNANEKGPILIYRGDEDRFLSVHTNSKSYSEINRKQVEDLGRRIKAARREVDRHLDSLPSDQRKTFERLLGIARQDPNRVHSPVVIVRNQKAKKVAGFECKSVSINRNDVLIAQACITPWKKIGMTQADIEIFRHLGNFQREAMGARGPTPLELVPNQPLDLLVQFDGFPLVYQRIVDGRPKSAIRVKSVRMLTANDSLFEVPDEYVLRPGHGAFLSHLGIGRSPASPATP